MVVLMPVVHHKVQFKAPFYFPSSYSQLAKVCERIFLMLCTWHTHLGLTHGDARSPGSQRWRPQLVRLSKPSSPQTPWGDWGRASVLTQSFDGCLLTSKFFWLHLYHHLSLLLCSILQISTSSSFPKWNSRFLLAQWRRSRCLRCLQNGPRDGTSLHNVTSSEAMEAKYR